MLVPVRTSVGLHWCKRVKQCIVSIDVGMLNTGKLAADVSGIIPSSTPLFCSNKGVMP